jgi:hypothetical protein
MLSKLNKQDEESYFEKANSTPAEDDDGPMRREPAASSFKELGQIIDTTLLKAYLLTGNNALVGSLLRVSNMCHLGESEKMLTTYKVSFAFLSFHSFFFFLFLFFFIVFIYSFIELVEIPRAC